MAYSNIRLTLYGLITAIEADLRHAIATDLLIETQPEELLPKAAYERACQRMEQDGTFESSSDKAIIEYLDFAECVQVLCSESSKLQGPIAKAAKKLGQSVAWLTPIRNRVMHSRPLEFDDFGRVSALCAELLSYPSHLFQKLRETEEFIKADPNYVFSLSLDELGPAATKVFHNLPIPDFDETGFLGRADEGAALLRICKNSPWPVVTILGEGGAGKSALALKVAYELLDDEAAGYDAIVWTTSKTTRLTVTDIQKIDDAIRTSVGVFQDISTSLLNASTSTEEILEYLNTFKIFLVLDNLETVLDDNIRSFLSRISSSSKVLITSRVGLGELEYRFPLRAMKDQDAVALLRATAHVRRVEEITRTSNAILNGYCRKMNNNPLFIKWLVSCVQSGKRPEDALQNSTIFLDYCLSNVVDHVSDDARFLARAMLAVSGPHSQPILAYLTEFDGDRLQLALQQLITTNIAALNSQPTNAGYESLYDLGELPRQYLLKACPPSALESTSFAKRRVGLARIHEQFKAQGVNPYNPNSVAIRTRDDVVVAKSLADALLAVGLRKFERAFACIENAKKLAPSFAEVYRVEGWALYFARNYAAARQSYETAIEIDPRSPALRYWYAGFLLRAHEDPAAAVEHLLIAQQYDRAAPEIRVECARSLSYLFRFDEADAQLLPVLEIVDGPTKVMRVAYDGWIQIAVRRGNFRMTNADFLGGLEALEEAVRRFETIPRNYLDRKIYETVCYPAVHIPKITAELSHSDARPRAEWLGEKLEQLTSEMSRDGVTNLSRDYDGVLKLALGDAGAGIIVRVDVSKKYGFIRVDGGGTLFYHSSKLSPGIKANSIRVGMRVNFCVGENHQGLVADDVRPFVEESSGNAEGSVEADRRVKGVICRIAPSSKYGFIRSDDGREFFFHQTALKPPLSITRLYANFPVYFSLCDTDRGPMAISIEETILGSLSFAVLSRERLIGTIVKHDRGATFGFAHVAGRGDILVRSQDFRDQETWNIIDVGDRVSFIVETNKNDNYLGKDIDIESNVDTSTG